MKKLIITLLIVSWCVGSLYAQFVRQSWNFETNMGGWSSGWISGQPMELSQDRAASGVQSAKVSTKEGEQQIIFANDGLGSIVQEGYIAKAKVWVDASLVSKSGVIKFFWQSGSGWTWYNGPEKSLNQLVANEWNEIEATLTNVGAFKRLGIQVWMSAASVETIYIDDITISSTEVMVSDWAFFRRGPAPNWKLVPSTTPGTIGIRGTTPPNGPWTVIRGEFPATTIPQTRTLVVTGTLVFDSAGIETWSALRFGLAYHTQAGTIYNAGTDSARWRYVKYPGTDSAQVVDAEEIAIGGYTFVPPSSTFDIPNWANGGGGTQGVIRNSSWLSTFGNNLSTGIIRQKPSRAIAEEGTYQFAISVQHLANGTKEVTFFLVKPQGESFSYWWAGKFIDTTIIPATFNGLCFGINGGNGAERGQLRGLYLSNVKVTFGDPLVIPEAPWEAYYIPIANWGVLRRGLSATWRFVPGTFDGSAGLVGSAPPRGTWNVIRGAFVEPVTIKPGRSLKITGKLTFDSAGITVWNGLRFGLNNLPNAGTLYNPLTDSARWRYVRYAGTDSARVVDGEETGTGYLFCPPSSTFDIPNWANGGGGTQGIVRNNSSWISTYGSNLSTGIIRQVPYRSIAEAGTYDFAISVQLRSDGTKEVKFFLVKPQGESFSYWWAGSFVDTTIIPPTFNGVTFGIINSDTWGIRGFSVEDVKVDTGVITIPEAPFQKYLVTRWGIVGSRYGGWFFEKGVFDGSAGIVGTAPNTDIAAIRGEFDPFTPTIKRGLKITGQIESGFAAPASLRLGIFNATLGNLVIDNTPSDGDSTRWTGAENAHTGLLIIPRSGNNPNPTWGTSGGAVGSIGVVSNALWFSPETEGAVALGNFEQMPKGAIADSGLYDFALSVTRNESEATVRFKLWKPGYTYAASFVTTHSAVTNFNCISFALTPGNTVKGLRVYDVTIDTTSIPIDVGTVTNVEAESVIPREFALSQNYPNPFNPTTAINYDIPMTSNVKITIYDILGRAVATLVDEVQPARSYTIHWNASNFSTGVYFCKIEARSIDGAKNFSAVKKLLLLK
ncbi:MAG: T9SS type A sorting domain-containing protein [Bacteroidetes bacterium]|nr:T9SS type A sorting domain-containing protein [Bacteroidota bacterium]